MTGGYPSRFTNATTQVTTEHDDGGTADVEQGFEAAIQIGEIVRGKYRVERVLGMGGMGVVVAATHLHLDQLVALKFIRYDATDHDVVSRFEREARVAARLRSEHVVRVLDLDRLDSGVPFIVMEHLDGCDLAAVLARGGPIDVASACDYIIQACAAVAEAHHLGIVHRDLKPENLFLATAPHEQPIIKLLDFGVSKQPAPPGEAGRKTSVNTIMGSPRYMAPEQLRSPREVDARADIWSLGVILYELVSGCLPFHADTLTALCLKIAADPPAPLQGNPPPGLESVIARALAKDPARRYPSAVELARALVPFAARASARQQRAQRAAAGDDCDRTPLPGAEMSARVDHAVAIG